MRRGVMEFIVVMLFTRMLYTNGFHCEVDEYRCFHNNVCIPMENFCDEIQDCPDGSDETSTFFTIQYSCESECLARHDVYGERYIGKRRTGIQENGTGFDFCTNECRGKEGLGITCTGTDNRTVYCDIPYCGKAASKNINCEFDDGFCDWKIIDMNRKEIVTNAHRVSGGHGIIQLNASESDLPRKKIMISKILIVPDSAKAVCAQMRYSVSVSEGINVSTWQIWLKVSQLCKGTITSPQNCTDCFLKCSAKTTQVKQVKVRVEMQLNRQYRESVSAIFNISHLRVYEGECKDFTATQEGDECTDEEFKCNDESCIPLGYTCDGYEDCPDLSDELFCDQYLRCADDEMYCKQVKRCIPTSYASLFPDIKKICAGSQYELYLPTSTSCPNHFSCKGLLKTCLTSEEVCDSKPHCKYGDDEIGCTGTCPALCSCDGLGFTCPVEALVDIPVFASYIEVAGPIGNMSRVCGQYRIFLIHLKLSNNGITDISCMAIDMMFPALRVLDLSQNEISVVPDLRFPRLEKLILDYNWIIIVEATLSVPEMSLTHNSLSNILWEFHYSDRPVLTSFRSAENITRSAYHHIRSVVCFLRKLDLSYNGLSRFGDFGTCQNLFYLDLSNNKISSLNFDSFNGLASLKYLNLSNNMLSEIGEDHFLELYLLLQLQLDKNEISTIHEKSFADLRSLILLDLSNNRLKELDLKIFKGQTSLLSLYLENNGLTTIRRSENSLGALEVLVLRNNRIMYLEQDLFGSLNKLRSLDLRGNYIVMGKDLFDGLGVLRYLYVDSFVLCCVRPTSVEEEDCRSPVDIFSSCSNLIDIGVLHICIWFTAALSLSGNLFALILRIRNGTWIRESRDIFVTHLCFSDFLMGLYLVFVAYTDVQTRGRYGYYHNGWKGSLLCKLCGVIVTCSSEASTLCILAITIDRYILFKNPLSLRQKQVKSANIAVVCIWIFSLSIATFPIFWDEFFEDNFYGRSSVCISLPLTKVTLTFDGWEYSFSLFIGLNLFIYILVVIGQIAVFNQIKSYGSCMKEDKRRQREISVAKSLSAVVISDTLCWFPIAAIGCLALAGIEISNNVYAWIIVFVLPLNSAINPFLYTLTSYRKRQARLNSTARASNDKQPTNTQISVIRPLHVPANGLANDAQHGGMIIIIKPWPLDQVVDVWFSDDEGWKTKPASVKLVDNVIFCDVPPYKRNISEPVNVKVQLLFIKMRKTTPPVVIQYVPGMAGGGFGRPYQQRKQSI